MTVFSKIGRREFLSSAAGLAAAACTFGKSPAATASRTLRNAAAHKGLLYGAAIRGSLGKDPQFAALVAEQCSIVVPEGALKWDTLRPAPDRFDFSGSDADLQFAQSNNIQYRGHNLVWHEALPKWFDATVNSGNAGKFMADHIATVVGRYAGKMHSWDVVNEIVELHDGQANGLRNTPWLRLMGPGYIETAFHAARQADPNALLVYNEDQLESETFHADAKRQAVVGLLEDLLKKNVPVQALGIESHIQPDTKIAGPNFKNFLQTVSDLGLVILVTEMDVSDQTMPGNVDQRDAHVAQQYRDYLSCVLQYAPVAAVLTWGLTDRYTWLAAHNPRQDGQAVRPLPFDSDCRPTKAVDAILQAFADAPARSERVRKANRLSRVTTPES